MAAHAEVAGPAMLPSGACIVWRYWRALVMTGLSGE